MNRIRRTQLWAKQWSRTGVLMLLGAVLWLTLPLADTKAHAPIPQVRLEANAPGEPDGSHLVLSTLLGGDQIEAPGNVWANEQGYVFFMGRTNSKDFPLKNPLLSTPSERDSQTFLACFSPGGEAVFSTFLNSKGFLFEQEAKFDGEGNFYVMGKAEHTDFIVTNPIQNLKKNTGVDVFVMKFSAAGKFLYSSLIAGSDEIQPAQKLLVGRDGSVVLLGVTRNKSFPLKKAFQKYLDNYFPPLQNPHRDMFVTKLDAEGNLVFSTFLGGLGDDELFSAQFDQEENIYICGMVFSNFPTKNAFQKESFPSPTHRTAITKFTPTGKVVYSTFLSGEVGDRPKGFQVSPEGRAAVAVVTSSRKMPLVNAFDSSPGDLDDLFVASFDPVGHAQFTTYLAGEGDDYLTSFHLDEAGNLFVTGGTSSADFPTLRAFQPQKKGVYNFFITKLNLTGSAAFSTFLGGSKGQDANVSYDRFGNLYFVGAVSSEDFPWVNNFPVTFRTYRDFIAKVSNEGEIVYSTLLPAQVDLRLENYLVDPDGYFIATGQVDPDSGLIIKNAFQTTPGQLIPGGGSDAFLFKMNPKGELVFSTYLGGAQSERTFFNSLRFNAKGEIWLAGETRSTNFPLIDPTQGIPTDAGTFSQPNIFLTKFSPEGKVLFSTYLGGGGLEYFSGLRDGGNGRVCIMGTTTSTDFPTFHPFQSNLKGTQDAFLAIFQ